MVFLVSLSLSMPGPVGRPSTEGSAGAAIAAMTHLQYAATHLCSLCTESCCDGLGIGSGQAPGKCLSGWYGSAKHPRQTPYDLPSGPQSSGVSLTSRPTLLGREGLYHNRIAYHRRSLQSKVQFSPSSDTDVITPTCTCTCTCNVLRVQPQPFD